MAAKAISFDELTLIPDLLHASPQARGVLDRYGLRGCGGPSGPYESLGFFARAHDVPITALLQELHRAVHGGTACADESEVKPTLADGIYRPFFLAGIISVLTLGAVWGAYLLLRIGLAGSFSAAGLHEINAHGHAQIFGWVGLFVMGFAYQAFPRFKHTSLAYPHLAIATFVMMLVGLTARSLAQPLVGSLPRLWWAAVGGSLLEIAAVSLFVGLICLTWQRGGKPLAVYDYYITAALAWFVIQAVYESIYLTATLGATGPGLTQLVATWQAPLRELQIHGFALLMILGVSQRIFHHFYSLPAANPRLSLALLPVLNLAVVGEAVGLVLMRLANPIWAALWYASAVVLTIAVAALVIDWHLWGQAEDEDRSLKFLRVAYVWLFISLAMLVSLPLHQTIVLRHFAPDSAAAQMGFSHAYYGAARHAITVGFVSLMIVGVAAKVVPTLNGIDGRSLSSLWIPFVLINAGCLLRVVGQTLTDFTPLAFPFAGVSGLLEVSGLAVWGAHLALIMLRRPEVVAHVAPAGDNELSGREILPTDRVSAVLDAEPRLLDDFLGAGFTLLASSHARRTLARVVTLRQACRRVGVEESQFVARLNQTRSRLRSLELPLVAVPAKRPTEYEISQNS
jgi:hypothetical protein